MVSLVWFPPVQYHSTSVLTALDREFTILDGALDAFVTEMKAQEKWDDVTIVVSSDFGR